MRLLDPETRRRLGALALLLVVGIATYRSTSRSDSPTKPRFRVPTPERSQAGTGKPAPLHRVETLGSSVASVHVASICEPSAGTLAAVWYGGTREGAKDVAIWFATRTDDRWTEPADLVTAARASRELGHYVRKVGNAVLFADDTGRMSLLFVTITVGGWSGSSLCLKESTDGGRTWTPSQRLVLSPFFNISELVKNGPTPLEGGGWVVPIYHELFGKFPELLWLEGAPGSVSARKTRAFGGRTAFQPSLVALDPTQAVMLCRTASSQRDLYLSRTADGGLSWSPPEPTGLPNSDSGIDAVRLADGRLLLAFNDTPDGRANLRLAVSSDAGRTWTRGPYLENEAGAEFSYPFLLRARDGTVHLAYTWKREAIRIVSFNTAWLDAATPATGATP